MEELFEFNTIWSFFLPKAGNIVAVCILCIPFSLRYSCQLAGSQIIDSWVGLGSKCEVERYCLCFEESNRF